jgi:competence protein ComFB
MEEAVHEEVRATMANINICRCDKCYNDVCALVLNNMGPQYVTSREGILMKKAKTLLSIDTLTKLSSEIFNAMDKVKNNPEH